MLLHGDVNWTPLAEAMLHFAARAEHVARTIEPALAAGTWVVCDRFSDSTMAYQGYGQGADRGAIATLARLIGLVPDLTIVLDLPVAMALQRLSGRPGTADRYERLGPDFFARVNAGFHAIAAAEPRCVLLPAEDSESAVAARIWQAVRARLSPPASPATP